MKEYKDRKNRSQIITLMGIILAISVFMISSLTSEIENIEFVTSSVDSFSISTEFTKIKETFGISLNYNLADLEIDVSDETILYGNINNLTKAFNQTREEFFNISIQYGLIFDASFNHVWYSQEDIIQGYDIVFYKVDTTLYLDNGKSKITEDVYYLIGCTPEV